MTTKKKTAAKKTAKKTAKKPPARKAAKKPAKTRTLLATVSVDVGGRRVAMKKVRLGYNFQDKGLLIDGVIPFPATAVSAASSELAYDDGGIYLVVDTAKAAAETAAEAARTAARDGLVRKKAAVKKLLSLLTKKQQKQASAPTLFDETPPRIEVDVEVDLDDLAMLDDAAAAVGLRVTGAGYAVALDHKKRGVSAETVVFCDRAFDVGTFVGQRLTTAVGNHDNDEDDLAAAVRAYMAGTDGRVTLVDDDTLVLVPKRAPTKVEAKAIERAFAALSFEDSSAEVTRRVLAEARARRFSFFWWD